MPKRMIYCLLALAIVAVVAAPVWASGSGPGGEGDINPLAPSAWKMDLALWTAVVFLLLLAILWRLAWTPIAEGLDKREQSVADQIAQTNAAYEKAKAILADYERQLATAQEQVRGLLDQGRRDAEQLGREMLEKAKAEAKAEYQRAVHQIDAAAAAAIKELAAQSATLAVELAGKIVRAKLNPADHTRLIDQAVAGFVEGKNHISRN